MSETIIKTMQMPDGIFVAGNIAYDDTENLGVTDTQNAIDRIASIAKGANPGLSYDSYQEAFAAIGAMDNTQLRQGWNIHIGTVGVPDLWIFSVENEAVEYTYVDDQTFVDELTANVKVQVGYYKLGQLETQKVDILGIEADIAALSDEVDQCFQSVSSGKATVASAITEMGVSTASDATFDTMATNISSIPLGKILTVGTGTSSGSFDIITLCEENGIDYHLLTEDNFILTITKIPNLQVMDNTVYTTGNAVGRAHGCTPTRTYDQINGLATVSNCRQYIRAYLNGQSTYTREYQNMTFTLYLVFAGYLGDEEMARYIADVIIAANTVDKYYEYFAIDSDDLTKYESYHKYKNAVGQILTDEGHEDLIPTPDTGVTE